MALTNEEKTLIRYHLGYSNLDPAYAIFQGIPQAQATLFLVNACMEKITDVAIPLLRQLLATMSSIEQEIQDARQNLVAERVDTIVLRPIEPGLTQTDALEREYVRFGYRMCELLGCAPNPYSVRYQKYTPGGSGINARVVR